MPGVECIACQGFTFRRDALMAPLGFGNCCHEPEWRYHSAVIYRDCAIFKAADPGDVEKRRAWLEKARGARKAGSNE